MSKSLLDNVITISILLPCVESKKEEVPKKAKVEDKSYDGTKTAEPTKEFNTKMEKLGFDKTEVDEGMYSGTEVSDTKLNKEKSNYNMMEDLLSKMEEFVTILSKVKEKK